MITPIKAAVIGVGSYGQYHAQSFTEITNTDLVGIVDLNEEQGKEKARQLGTKWYPTSDSLFQHQTVDIVSIVTPNHTHYDLGIQCLEAGCHVLIEKPFTLSLKDTKHLLQFAETSNRIISVCHQYRLFRTNKLLKALIESGQIGNPLRVSWTWNQFRTQTYFDQLPWVKDHNLAGGGIISNQFIHDLDLLCFLFGQPESVSTFVGTQLNRAPVEDTATIMIRFENGTLGTISCSYNQSDSGNYRYIQGDKGVIAIDHTNSSIVDKPDTIRIGTYQRSLNNYDHLDSHHQPSIHWQTRYTDPWDRVKQYLWPKKLFRALGIHCRPFIDHRTAMLQQFVRALNGEGKPLLQPAEILQTMSLYDAVLTSAKENQHVKLSTLE